MGKKGEQWAQKKKSANEGPARGKGPPQSPARFSLGPGARFSNAPVALRARNKIFRSKSKKSMVPS